MGKILVGKMRGMSMAAKAGVTLAVTLLVSVLMYTYLPMRAQAVIKTYYLNPYTATSVGFDGTSNMTTYADIDLVYATNAKRGIMDTNQPTTSSRYRLYDFTGQATFTNQEFYRAYGPVYAVDTQVDANAYAEFEATMVRTGNSASVTVQLFDYNPADGSVVQIGNNVTRTLSQSNNNGSLQRFNNGTGTAAYFGNPAYKMVAGHRLQLRFLVSANNSQPALLLYANPSNAPSGSARLVVNESTIANLAVSNGTAEPGNITIGPSPNNIDSYPVDTFGLQLDGTAYDSITTVTITMGAGSSQYIGKVMITNTDNTTVYGSLTAPTSGENWTITTTSMPAYGLQASQDPIDYHVRIIPKSHSAVAAPPGGTYTISGRVTAVTHSQLGTVTISDSGSSTITIDNTSPAAPTWGTVTPGNGQVQLNWNNPGGDFAGVVILRNTETIYDAPIEGRSYFAGNYLGTSTIVYAGTGSSFTDTTAGNGTGFYYKIFAVDSFGNYSLGAQTGPHTPSNPNKTTVGAPSALGATATSITVKMPYSGDPNNNNTYTVNYRLNGAGGWTNHVTNASHAASPYTTTISGLTAGQVYDVQCIYNDTDGINIDPPANSYTATITAIQLPVYQTIPGPVAATVAGTSTINIEMPYSGDANGNNTYLIEWEDTASPGVWKSKSGAHAVNPYMTAISGLSPGNTYNVRMTFQDADGVTGGSGAVQTVNGVTLQVAGDTGMLHTSQRFPSTTKWGGSWGIDGGMYGAFTCATCHQPSASNIKAIRGTINSPENTFPAGADASVVFQNITSFGKDASGRTTSNRICEVCHSQTKFHRYNTTGQPGGVGHFNNKDCTQCHPHGQGFRASCDACHGNPPVTSNTDNSNNTGLVWRDNPTGATSPASAGAHQRHSVSRSMKCETCHNQNTMPVVSNTIQMGFAANATNVPGFQGSLTFGNFSGRSPLLNGYSFVASSGGTTVSTGATYKNSCSVACHGNWTGSNGTIYRPSWVAGSSQAVCGACHGASAAQAPTRGSHTKHASNAAGNYSFACTTCHPSVSDNAHVNGNVQWALNSADARITGAATYKSANSGGTLAIAPSGSYGQCGNLYCHSNGLNAAAPTYQTPTWGSTLNCGSCHGSKASATLTTGSHAKHLVSYECAHCHNLTVTSGSANLSDTSVHVNRNVNLQFPAGGTIGTATYGGSNAPVAKTSTGTGGFGTCNNVKCHNDGSGVYTGTFVAKTSPTWGQTGGCDKCHGNGTYTTDYRKAAPLYADGSPKPNAHQFHVNAGALNGTNEIHCSDCHSTVTADNTSINGTNPTHHANNQYNLAQGFSAGTYFDGDYTGQNTTVSVVMTFSGSPTASTCANVSCHPVAAGKDRSNSSISWNSNYKCIDCHSIVMDQTDTFHHAMRNYSTSYPTTAPNGSATNGTNPTNRRCTMCHVDHKISSPRLNTNSTGRAYNLRTGITVSPTTTTGYTNTDFVKDGTGGICISCHYQAKTKDATRRRNDTGVTVTPVVSYANFTGSAHNYNVPGKILSDGSTVNGNCSKCHNALLNETSTFMNISTVAGNLGLSFGNHNSGIRRLQGSLGAAGGETAEEQICYRCHSISDPNQTPGGGPAKAIAQKDYYGVATMTAAAEDLFNIMKNNGSRTADPSNSFTNKLYFKPGASESDYDGTSYPMTPKPDVPTNDTDLGDTFAGGNYIIRSMSPWEPTTSYATDIKSQATAVNALQYWPMVKFVSPPVAQAVTVPAGSWIINIYSRESTTSLNARVRYRIYKWGVGATSALGSDGTDSKGTDIVTLTRGATELSTTRAPGANRQLSINVPATNLSLGEKIVVDLGLETNNNNNGTAYFYFGNGAPSNLTLPGFVMWTYGAPAINGYGHNVNGYAGIHKPSSTDETQAFISTNRHVECGDCHNPHAAKGGSVRLHTAGVTVANNRMAGVLNGVSGVVPTWGASNWTSPTGYTTGIATAEYQICFKCHSGANTNYASWGGAGALAWTDLGLEFNTKNKSAHPVVASLNTTNYPNSSGALTAAKLKAPWNTNQGNQLMTCSDCHSSSSTASKGPHGSSYRWMLSGVNKAWPFTQASLNGTSSGTTFKLGSVTTNQNTDDGLFCLNCHPITGTNSMHNNASTGQHSWSNTARGACVSCHIRVPHGGKVKRLIRAMATPANVPARYWPNGNGGEVNNGTAQSQPVINAYNGGSTFDSNGCSEHTSGTDTW